MLALGIAGATSIDRPDATNSSVAAVKRTAVLGYSVLGRPIHVLELGDPNSPTKVLVVGCIHGDECAGLAIVQRLARGPVIANVDLWLLPNLNPDGRALGTRLNGRGVDLNRNFSSEWKPIGRRWDPQYSGPRPFSEPETRLARALVLRVQPALTIWFHQPQALVRAWGPSVGSARCYARLAVLPFRRIRWLAGTAPNWQNHRFSKTSSFVVELPPGPLPAPSATRHAAAIRRLAGEERRTDSTGRDVCLIADARRLRAANAALPVSRPPE